MLSSILSDDFRFQEKLILFSKHDAELNEHRIMKAHANCDLELYRVMIEIRSNFDSFLAG